MSLAFLCPFNSSVVIFLVPTSQWPKTEDMIVSALQVLSYAEHEDFLKYPTESSEETQDELSLHL